MEITIEITGLKLRVSGSASPADAVRLATNMIAAPFAAILPAEVAPPPVEIAAPAAPRSLPPPTAMPRVSEKRGRKPKAAPAAAAPSAAPASAAGSLRTAGKREWSPAQRAKFAATHAAKRNGGNGSPPAAPTSYEARPRQRSSDGVALNPNVVGGGSRFAQPAERPTPKEFETA
jgi:hypothetical protein